MIPLRGQCLYVHPFSIQQFLAASIGSSFIARGADSACVENLGAYSTPFNAFDAGIPGGIRSEGSWVSVSQRTPASRPQLSKGELFWKIVQHMVPVF
jgi:hypothetical protein